MFDTTKKDLKEVLESNENLVIFFEYEIDYAYEHYSCKRFKKRLCYLSGITATLYSLGKISFGQHIDIHDYIEAHEERLKKDRVAKSGQNASGC